MGRMKRSSMSKDSSSRLCIEFNVFITPLSVTSFDKFSARLLIFQFLLTYESFLDSIFLLESIFSGASPDYLWISSRSYSRLFSALSPSSSVWRISIMASPLSSKLRLWASSKSPFLVSISVNPVIFPPYPGIKFPLLSISGSKLNGTSRKLYVSAKASFYSALILEL